MKGLRRLTAAVAAAAAFGAAPALAQGADGVSIRPFLLVSAQKFAAADTFDAVFETSRGTFLGGGGQVTFGRVFIEVSASRFHDTGERAFTNDGDVFRLGIPLTVRITPVEVSGGYRAALTSAPWLVPYGGFGVGSYRYEETSDFAEADENVDVRHTGYLVLGGAEVRLHRWIGVSVDAQYTHIGDVLGNDGLSKDFGEDNLGGVAARFRVIVGR
jgi:hypothetical protein